MKNSQKKKTISETTFGNFKASYRLAEVLNELDNKNTTQKLGRFLGTYFKTFKELSTISDLAVREETLKIVYSHFRLRLMGYRFEYKVETHALNVMNAFYKIIFHERVRN
jgi:hypothetical protein